MHNMQEIYETNYVVCTLKALTLRPDTKVGSYGIHHFVTVHHGAYLSFILTENRKRK